MCVSPTYHNTHAKDNYRREHEEGDEVEEKKEAGGGMKSARGELKPRGGYVQTRAILIKDLKQPKVLVSLGSGRVSLLRTPKDDCTDETPEGLINELKGLENICPSTRTFFL